jgi:DNA ligase-1
MTVKKAAHVSDERAQEIINRAASQGRKLRQDEKAKLNGPPIMKAQSFKDHPVDPTGWWMSEKFDGVRAFWTGKEFISSQGNIYLAPAWFAKDLPKTHLDGELWLRRKGLQDTIRAIRDPEKWGPLKFKVFDLPTSKDSFEDRMANLAEIIPAGGIASIIWHERCTGLDHMKRTMDALVADGAEGIMIQKPGSRYEPAKRSYDIRKVKPFQDAEGVVIGHSPGEGKHVGRLGALIVRLPDGKSFNVGTGFTDLQRKSPPEIGAHITFRFTETTDGGIPKCASFVGPRDYE